MSFVTTHPEALTVLAGNLQVLGSAMAAQNAAAAAPTTGVVPAAADDVSGLQAAVFDAYGTLYQQISAEAAAIHDMFVQTLKASAGSYEETEAANQVAAGSSPLSGLLGSASSSSPTDGLTDILGSTGLFGLSGNAANIGNIGFGNTVSAASDLLGLASGGLLSNTVAEPGIDAGAAAGAAAALTSAGAGIGPAALGAGPVAVTVGQAASISGMSVPPSWASATAAAGTAPATLTGAGWTAAAPHAAPVTAMPTGMPGAASATRGGFGFGTPRYGVKPIVMPRPAVG